MHDESNQAAEGRSPLDDPHVLDVFKREVWQQCSFALRATEALNTALAAPDAQATFAALQSLLISVANLSKLLWGARKGKEAERKILRDALGVPDDSPLRSRALRNHFEHFDERLEEWIERDPNRIFVDMNVGPRTMIGGLDRSQSFLRNFDNTRATATFWDEEYPLQPVVDAVVELAERAKPDHDRLREEIRRGDSPSAPEGED